MKKIFYFFIVLYFSPFYLYGLSAIKRKINLSKETIALANGFIKFAGLDLDYTKITLDQYEKQKNSILGLIGKDFYEDDYLKFLYLVVNNHYISLGEIQELLSVGYKALGYAKKGENITDTMRSITRDKKNFLLSLTSACKWDNNGILKLLKEFKNCWGSEKTKKFKWKQVPN